MNRMEIPLTETEFDEGMNRRAQGAHIQDAFPNLTADQREFLMTGATPEEWDAIFGDNDE